MHHAAFTKFRKPRLVIARPRINIVELGDTAEIRMPVSKIAIWIRNTHLIG
jgi:hypothetical protein